MSSTEQRLFEIRSSPMHGSGAFALGPIPAGSRLVEYTGERISHAEADSRPEIDDGTGFVHVVLFTVDSRTVIDARVGGNEAQYFNHSCDGNCEAVVDQRRVFLETTRAVGPGEELTYDYEMEYAGEDLETARALYPCRCGATNCRGTLLDLPEKMLKLAAVRPKARRKSTAKIPAAAPKRGTKAPAKSASARGSRSRRPKAPASSSRKAKAPGATKRSAPGPSMTARKKQVRGRD